jgi:hypothetical protein
VQYNVDAPVNAHVELFSKYTVADIHDGVFADSAFGLELGPAA